MGITKGTRSGFHDDLFCCGEFACAHLELGIGNGIFLGFDGDRLWWIRARSGRAEKHGLHALSRGCFQQIETALFDGLYNLVITSCPIQFFSGSPVLGLVDGGKRAMSRASAPSRAASKLVLSALSAEKRVKRSAAPGSATR